MNGTNVYGGYTNLDTIGSINVINTEEDGLNLPKNIDNKEMNCNSFSSFDSDKKKLNSKSY